jgi:hypothetical protein
MGTPLEVHRAEGGGGLETGRGWRAQGAVVASEACALTDLAVLAAGVVSGRDGAGADGVVMLGAYGEYGATRSLALYRGLMAWRRLLSADAVTVLEPFFRSHLKVNLHIQSQLIVCLTTYMIQPSWIRARDFLKYIFSNKYGYFTLGPIGAC